jgi:hypothetical protein
VHALADAIEVSVDELRGQQLTRGHRVVPIDKQEPKPGPSAHFYRRRAARRPASVSNGCGTRHRATSMVRRPTAGPRVDLQVDGKRFARALTAAGSTGRGEADQVTFRIGELPHNEVTSR